MLANNSVKYLLNAFVIWNLIVSGKPLDFEAFGDIPSVCKTGSKQSPIDISMKNVIRKNYDTDDLFKVLNQNERTNHLTISKSVEQQAILNTSSHGRKQLISGSILSNQTYVFSEAHIHRSHDDNNGTEHSFEGKRFAVELHCVYVNSKYANIIEASSHPDGLAVIGILFKVDDNVPYNDDKIEFSTFCQSFDEERSINSSSIKPKLTSSFFYYNGSLTLPPCEENVRWIVLAKPQPISSATMQLLRSDDTKIIESHHVRRLKPINGRRIELYER